jgi:hypothetical protein
MLPEVGHGTDTRIMSGNDKKNPPRTSLGFRYADIVTMVIEDHHVSTEEGITFEGRSSLLAESAVSFNSGDVRCSSSVITGG